VARIIDITQTVRMIISFSAFDLPNRTPPPSFGKTRSIDEASETWRAICGALFETCGDLREVAVSVSKPTRTVGNHRRAQQNP
jgi:hypothetical protein